MYRDGSFGCSFGSEAIFSGKCKFDQDDIVGRLALLTVLWNSWGIGQWTSVVLCLSAYALFQQEILVWYFLCPSEGFYLPL